MTGVQTCALPIFFDLGWDKATRFRLEPAFYSAEVNVLVNLDAWKALNDRQKAALNAAAAWLEGLDAENVALNAAEKDRQAKAGIQAIDFGPAGSKRFTETAYNAAWKTIITRAPENGPRLRQLAGN